MTCARLKKVVICEMRLKMLQRRCLKQDAEVLDLTKLSLML